MKTENSLKEYLIKGFFHLFLISAFLISLFLMREKLSSVEKAMIFQGDEIIRFQRDILSLQIEIAELSIQLDKAKKSFKQMAFINESYQEIIKGRLKK